MPGTIFLETSNGCHTDSDREGNGRETLNHHVRYIHTTDGLKRLERSLANAGDLAVDCEAAGYHRYSDRLCLVQLSTRAETFVLDPLAVDLTSHLKPHLEDPARRILMHGGSYDLRLLRRDLGIAVARLADTQVAASFLGEPATGLQTLLHKHLGVELAKKYQKADWARRPLPRDMIDYAAGDTCHLHRLTAVLDDRLRELRRLHWAEDECRWLVASAAESSEAETPRDPVTRFKGARRMDARTVTALRAAIAWRDRIARSLDRAPFRVATDAALLGAVAARPATVRQLADVKGFSPRLAAKSGRSLLDALGRVRRMARRDLQPYPARRRGRGRPTPEEEATLDRITAVRNTLAEELGLDRGRIMANHLLREVVAVRPASLAELEAMPGVRGWQVGILGRKLMEAL